MNDQLEQAASTAATHLRTAAEILDADTPPEARDWAGFFQAISAFIAQILPLILPLFIKTTPPKV